MLFLFCGELMGIKSYYISTDTPFFNQNFVCKTCYMLYPSQPPSLQIIFGEEYKLNLKESNMKTPYGASSSSLTSSILCANILLMALFSNI
jgi:hypothetical protein